MINTLAWMIYFLGLLWLTINALSMAQYNWKLSSGRWSWRDIGLDLILIMLWPVVLPLVFIVVVVVRMFSR